MKITEVNLTENVTKPIGLSPVSMKKIGSTILLAGKNGSGKTRILNLIRQHASDLHGFIQRQADAKNNISRLEYQLAQQPQQKQNLEQSIKNYEQKINDLKQRLGQQQPQRKIFEQNIATYELNINSWKQQLEQQLEQKKSFDEQIKSNQKIVDLPIPILSDIEQQKIMVVDFVPNKIELDDWSNHSKQQWMQRANHANTPGVASLHQATIPLIQQVIERWVNATHPGLNFSESDIKKSTDDYNRLQDIVKSFLGIEFGWDKDGFSTIFGKPVAKAELSAGQRVLLQLCVAIFAQGGSLSNHIIFMDEPENHLHPSAVIDLLDAIKAHNPDGQIWIATHSIPLLSHFDASSLWYVENGSVEHSGKKPELVLKSLLGDEERIQKLRDFTSLPSELARNRFAFECLCPPKVVETDSKDPQSIQLNEQLKVIWEGGKTSINLLDFGAGKGRMIANLTDYENVSKDTLNYYAYDPFDLDKEYCLQNISLFYDDSENRYYNSLESLRTKLDDNFFDVVVLSNVLHEIPHTEWCGVFKEMQKMLKKDGYLLLIEDCLIPTGELPHNNGFIVFNTLHLKKLFAIPATEKNFIQHDARFDSEEQRGRLMAHLIPNQYLNNISSTSIIDAIKELKESAKTEIRKSRSGETTYANGLAHSFWIQQLANATLCLAESGED